MCIIEHFGSADAVPQPPERCLSRKAGIMRCCPKFDRAHSQRFGEANREDCSKNSRVLKAHKYSIFGNLLSIRKMQDVGISRPICCYTSKLIRKKEIEQAIFIYNLILTRKAAFLTPTQENRNAAFFMPSCYAVRANKALIYAALRARK